MAGRRLQQKFMLNNFRSLHRSTTFCENKSSETLTTASKDVESKKQTVLPGSRGVESPLGPTMCNVSLINKYLFVWHREYKSIDDVPSRVRLESMSNMHSKTRIHIGIFMMVFTLFGCFLAVRSGKKEALTGDSIQKRIMDQHKVKREEFLASK